MAFVVEDGTGLAGANSFASVAEGDEYNAGHLYASDWTGATNDKKEAALRMATRLLDAAVVWNGIKKTSEQALGWPRSYAPEAAQSVGGALTNWMPYRYYDSDSVPKGIKDATCELARLLLKSDRTADPQSKGISSVAVGPIDIAFDSADRPEMLPESLLLMLRPFGNLLTSSTRFVNITRV